MTEYFVNMKVIGLVLLISHSLAAENDTVAANETVTHEPGRFQDNVEVLDTAKDISNDTGVSEIDSAITEKDIDTGPIGNATAVTKNSQVKDEETGDSFRNYQRRPNKQEPSQDGISSFLTKQFDALCNIVGMPC